MSSIDYGIIDNNPKFHSVSRLEKIRIYLLDKGPADDSSLWPITDHIKAMIENLFHSTDLRLKGDCIQWRKMLLEWYIEKFDEDEDGYSDA